VTLIISIHKELYFYSLIIFYLDLQFSQSYFFPVRSRSRYQQSTIAGEQYLYARCTSQHQAMAGDANGMSACVMESNCDLNGIAVRLKDRPDIRYFGSVICFAAQSFSCQYKYILRITNILYFFDIGDFRQAKFSIFETFSIFEENL